MQWEHKGLRFIIHTEPMGPLCLAAARVRQPGPAVRVRPFSAIGTSESEAIDLLKKQIRAELAPLPEG